MWIEILNKSFEETVEIKRNQPLGFLANEPENLNFRYETANKQKKENSKGKEFIENIQTENKGGNMVVLLTNATLLMQAET